MSLKVLDNINEIKKIDSKNMLGSLQLLANQAEQIIQTGKKITIPSSYSKVRNLVIVGMGGSALGGNILKSVFFSDFKVPVEIVNGYHVPSYVDKNTLVLLSSYSGTTEEVLSALKEAKSKKAKLLAIVSGGTLAELAKQQKIPTLVFSTENNPCGSPRMGLGYSIFGLLVLICRAGLLRCTPQKMREAVAALTKYDGIFGATVPNEKNMAKKLAEMIKDKSVWYVASEHLSGNAHAAANQMNENAKTFASYFLLPELNHHLMEGMLLPKNNAENLFFVMVESGLYDLRVQKRYEITKKVLEKNKIKYFSYKCTEKDKLSQVCELLAFSSYVSFYLAILEGIDPTANPYVDFFKEELKK